MRLCSQGTSASSLRLLQGRFTLDIGAKSFMENVVRAAQGRGRVPSPGGVARVCAGGTWWCMGLAGFGSSWDSSWRPFSNLKILWGQRLCWVALSGFGTDADLGITGTETGNTKEMWEFIYLFYHLLFPAAAHGVVKLSLLPWAGLAHSIYVLI